MFSTGRTQFLPFLSIPAAAASAWVHRLQIMPVLPPESWAGLCSWQGTQGALTGKSCPAEKQQDSIHSDTAKVLFSGSGLGWCFLSAGTAEHGTLLSQEQLLQCRAASGSGAAKSGESSSYKGRTSVIILIYSQAGMCQGRSLF